MAIRLKTIEYHIPTLLNLADNVLTALSTKTIYIPEGATAGLNFKSVIVVASIEEGSAQPAGNYTTRRLTVSVGGATATNYANSNLYTGSGENTTIFYSVDAAAHFNANWGSNTSRTLDIQVLLDGSASPSATPFVNVNVTVTITYAYDDSVTTQVKTVKIPLNAGVGTLNSSKPATPLATVPDLNTYLPEANKVIRDMFITVQGCIGATTNDSTLSMELDTSGAYTSQIMERGAASDRWSRLIYNFGLTGNLLGTGISHEFYLWSNGLTYNHQQTWMTVTYEFQSTATNDMMVSLELPVQIVAPLGGLTSADAQQGVSEFWVQESGISMKRLAFYAHWEQSDVVAGLNWRIGTGSAYSGYTSAGGTPAAGMCGGMGCMVRNDTGVPFIRGKNRFTVSTFRTDTADFGYNACGYFLLNYQANKPNQGYGAANRTVKLCLHPFTGLAEAIGTTRPTGLDFIDSGYFFNSIGVNYQYLSNTTSNPAGASALVERTSGERGLEWLSLYTDLGTTDPETGLRQVWSPGGHQIFKRWSGDPDTDRIDVTGLRRYRMVQNNLATAFHHLELILNYHAITYQRTTTVAGSAGALVELDLHRIYEGKDEIVQSTGITGNASHTWTWYDNTTGMFISAYEDSSHVGRSSNFFF